MSHWNEYVWLTARIVLKSGSFCCVSQHVIYHYHHYSNVLLIERGHVVYFSKTVRNQCVS